VSESEKSKEGYTTFYTLAVCVWYLVFTLYAYNFICLGVKSWLVISLNPWLGVYLCKS
jgi:hypothetical protein